MNTLINRLSQLIADNRGPELARMMSSLTAARSNGIVSPFELAQIKTAVRYMTTGPTKRGI